MSRGLGTYLGGAMTRKPIEKQRSAISRRVTRVMLDFIGIRKDGSTPEDSVEYVRRLRRDTRLDRLYKK
jgi:hypothetical protein